MDPPRPAAAQSDRPLDPARASGARVSQQELSRALHAARLAAGLTQAELATRVGTTQSAIARLESGVITPTVETLCRLADVLDLTFQIAPQVGLVVSATDPRPEKRRLAPTLDELRARREEILRIAATHGAGNVRVFGSVARGQARPDSDVDLLVEFEPGRTVLDLSELILDLQEALGYPVDVVEIRGEPPLSENIRREAVPV
jgi:predicted nucleotidyltransferase/DNA-binding XRE family transcriptional regulator